MITRKILHQLIAATVFLFPLVGKSAVYDCFTFFNEIDILEVRLNELYAYVDKFVITEAGEGISGPYHEYVFEQIKDQPRFAKFSDKIIYIKIERPINEKNPDIWFRENYIKNQGWRGLNDCEPNDLILFSDVDEIPRPELISKLAEAIITTPIIGLEQHMYRHFLNRDVGLWIGTVGIRYDWLSDKQCSQPCGKKHRLNDFRSHVCFNGQRELDGASIPIWVNGGWHFSSTGGFKTFLEKTANWSHFQNHAPKTLLGWRNEVDAHPLVPIDDTYPKFVQENIPYLISIGLIESTTSHNSARN